MKLSVARENYYALSGSASNSARQIAFAGIAIVWALNKPTDISPIGLDRPLVWACVWFALCLLADLLQYIVGAALWSYYARKREKELRHKLSEDPEIDAPRELNWPGIFFYYLKALFVAIGYIVLLTHLSHIIRSW